MKPRILLALLMALGLFATAARPQDPPETLRRKPRPVEGPAKAGDPKPDPMDDTKGAEDKTDTKDTADAKRSKADPEDGTSDDEEEGKIFDRLTKNSKAADDRLSEKDAGDDTRKLQKEVVKDIDKLMKQMQRPPQDQSQSSSSSSSSNDPSQSDGSSSGQSGSQSKGGQGQRKGQGQAQGQGQGGSGSMSRAEARQQRQKARGSTRSGGQPQPGREQAGKNGQNDPRQAGKQPGPNGKDPMGKNDPRTAQGNPMDPKDPMGDNPGRSPENPPKGGPENRMNDLYKDVWGHLPEKVRQEMDQYFREKFMPRYNELLRQYYSTIAEQNKKRDD